MAIKEKLQGSNLDGFSTSNGWLDRWKIANAIKELQIVGENGYVSRETITSWMERLQKLTAGDSSENIWNMKESGCIFKTLPDKGLVKKAIKSSAYKLKTKINKVILHLILLAIFIVVCCI